MKVDTPKAQPYGVSESILLDRHLRPEYGESVELLTRHPQVERLSRIGFLGTMSLLYRLQKQASRLDHALGCAYLSVLFAENLGLTDTTTRVLLMFSLLHDIGHTPFSHVIEPLLRARSRVYHEGVSSLLLGSLVDELERKRECVDGSLEVGGSLNLLKAVKDLIRGRQVAEHVLPSSILSLITGPITIDTLDGIARTADCFGLDCPPVDDIVSGFYLDPVGRLKYRHERLDLLLDFWRLKSHIYSAFVFSRSNQSAEAMINRAVELALTEDEVSRSQLSAHDDTAIEDKIEEHPRAAFLLDQLRAGRVLSLVLAAEDVSQFTRNRLRTLRRSSTFDRHALETGLHASLALTEPERAFVVVHFSKRKFFNIAESFFRQPRLIIDDFDVAIEFPRIFEAHRTYEFVGVFAPPFVPPSRIDRRHEHRGIEARLEDILESAST